MILVGSEIPVSHAISATFALLFTTLSSIFRVTASRTPTWSCQVKVESSRRKVEQASCFSATAFPKVELNATLTKAAKFRPHRSTSPSRTGGAGVFLVSQVQ